MTILTPPLKTDFVARLPDSRSLSRMSEIYDILDQAETLVFLDTEATGNGQNPRIIELAACELSTDGDLIGGYSF